MRVAGLGQLLRCDHERARADLLGANAVEQDRHREPAEFEPKLVDLPIMNLSL